MTDAALVLLGSCIGTAIWWLVVGHEMPLRRTRLEDERWRRRELGWAKHFARKGISHPPADPRWPMFHPFRRGGRQ